MAKLNEVKKAKRSAKPDSPFGTPAADETFEILIPEGAESGKIPAGDQYIAKLIGLKKDNSKSSGNPMWVWTFTIIKGDFQGLDFTLWTSLQSNALWKLADTLTALGVPWEPGQPINFKLREILGTLVRLRIKDDKRDGRELSKLDAVLPHPKGAGTKGKATGFIVPKKVDEDEEDTGRGDEDDETEEDEEEEETPRKVKGKGRIKEEEEEDEEEEDETEEEDEEDEEEDEEEEETPRRKVKGRKTDDDEWPAPPPSPARKKKVVEEEEDEEEEEAPRRKTKPTRGRKPSRL